MKIYTITMHTYDKNPGILTCDWQLIKTYIRKVTLYTSAKCVLS